MFNLADLNHFVVVMKNFGCEKVDFTREQHTHNQGVNPVLVPGFSPTSQLAGPTLSWFGLNLPA
jgi:hypothetical protein